MDRDKSHTSVGGLLGLPLLLLTAIAMEAGLVSNARWYNVLYVTVPLLVILLLFRSKKS